MAGVLTGEWRENRTEEAGTDKRDFKGEKMFSARSAERGNTHGDRWAVHA